MTGCLRTPVPQESVWQVLTDYEGLARTYSTVLESHSRLVDKQRQVLQAGSAYTCVGTCACRPSCVPKGSLLACLQSSYVLELNQLRLGDTRAQKCKWEFLVFSGSFDTRLAVSEDPAAGTLVFRQLHSSFMRTFEGRWQARASFGDRAVVWGAWFVEQSAPPAAVLPCVKLTFGVTQNIR